MTQIPHRQVFHDPHAPRQTYPVGARVRHLYDCTDVLGTVRAYDQELNLYSVGWDNETDKDVGFDSSVLALVADPTELGYT